MAISFDEFLALRKNLPVVDVRSEGEYQSGHIQNAINIPLLNNQERVLVGTDYKQKGQLEAIKTGFRLVGPRLLDIITEAERVTSSKEVLVHCWRGGMRSNNFCQFVGMAGIKTHSLKGGYKTYRQKALESFAQPLNLILLTGCTGSGKSEILRGLKASGQQVIDLETLASHKGSAFGGLFMNPQPTTEQFQNNLFEEILQLDPQQPIWVEDESIAIGHIFLPRDFWLQMNNSSLVQVLVDKDVRVKRLVEEYGKADKDEFLAIMSKIVKRLGGQHFNTAKQKLLEDDMQAVMQVLLTYYDKAYLHSIEKRKDKMKKIVKWDGEEIGDAVRAITT
ncbi:MAG TPA: tRNA 2-selenouridine(34) synthase MnmH [Cyclobacteriaceae bacterium]|jgi:tRNA 2-selenouridine synthase|nr:tRNA 2-selenouridine(34) synthase MnmH [Cytophagales bacterium]HRE67416.1 tRNA 2-selenouridine(34) synthase MnmH [Cyclobacteriaceae bacterium]HRF33439.1 tRNA 2-selenouridine(34) synthase MnmH [Cyclobacteriaceae bacterium]